jgi:hypothetical protein
MRAREEQGRSKGGARLQGRSKGGAREEQGRSKGGAREEQGGVHTRCYNDLIKSSQEFSLYPNVK